MYLYFVILGFLFICGSSIVINYLDEIFPDNKVAYFLNPSFSSIWNNISIVILPIITWGFISLPVLGDNSFFIYGILLNIFVSCCIIYVIKYGAYILFNKKNNLINVISIVFGTFWGSLIVYITLLLSHSRDSYMLFSILSLVIILLFYYILKKFPPKTNFFNKEL